MDAEEGTSEKRPTFRWTQSLPAMPEGDSCLLNVLVKLGDDQKPVDPKTGVKVTCTPCPATEGGLTLHQLSIEAQTENGKVELCSARLFAPVKPADTMWTYDRETNR